MKNEIEPLSCKLTTAELQTRKATVINDLRMMVEDRVELHNGVRYTFADTDSTFEKLVTFIKAERLCCDFFTFTLIAGEPGKLLLELTGPEGVKEFISEEVGF